MRNGLKALALVGSLAIVAPSANSATIERAYEIDLFDLVFISQGEPIQQAAYINLPVDPFVFGAVGDQLITTVTFKDGHRLRLVDGYHEVVQLQYMGPVDGAQGSRSLQELELLGITGNYVGSPIHSYDQQFGCGNCLHAFTDGDLTTSEFSFAGVRLTTTITELTVGAPYSIFVFSAGAGDIKILPVTEPGTLLQQLLDDVSGPPHVGPGKSLGDKISLAQVYYAVPDIPATCAVLTDFLREVRAQRGRKLTSASADRLTADAYAIMDAIGCD